MSTVPGPGSSTVQLPNDVLAIIVSYLDKRSLRQIRFCCRWLAKEASRYLFSLVDFEMRAADLERVIGIANSSMTADAVKTLHLHQTQRLEEFSFRDWCRKAAIFYDPLELDCEEDEEMDIEEEGPCSKKDQEKLRFLRFRERLFQEYEAQRNEPLLYDCLHAPGSSILGCVPAAPQSRYTSISRLETTIETLRRFQQACSGFEEAVQKFRNLQGLHVEFDLSHCDDEIYWRDHTIDVKYDHFYGIDEEQAIAEEAAPLALILRALGKRSASSSSLVSLTLELTGDPWWGLQDLEDPWIPLEPEVDNEGILSPLSQAVLKNNLTLMDDAFAYLTDICVKFVEKDEMPDFMQALASLLNKASGLTHLELNYVPLLFPLPRWQGFDMLTDINNHAMLSKITHLYLVCIQFSEASLLHTLSLVASSLKSITLWGCRLLGEDTWSHCYEGMRLIPFQVLNDLDFQECRQEVEHEEVLDTPSRDWSEKDVNARSVVTHHMSPSSHTRVGYSSDIYDYILKRTDSMPPLQKFHKGKVD